MSRVIGTLQKISESPACLQSVSQPQYSWTEKKLELTRHPGDLIIDQVPPIFGANLQVVQKLVNQKPVALLNVTRLEIGDWRTHGLGDASADAAVEPLAVRDEALDFSVLLAVLRFAGPSAVGRTVTGRGGAAAAAWWFWGADIHRDVYGDPEESCCGDGAHLCGCVWSCRCFPKFGRRRQSDDAFAREVAITYKVSLRPQKIGLITEWYG